MSFHNARQKKMSSEERRNLMYAQERDDYLLFCRSLSASTDDFHSNLLGSFPSDDVERVTELRNSLETKANLFLARVHENQPTRHQIARLREFYRRPPVRRGPPILTDEFRDDVLERLRETIVTHWGVNVGPFDARKKWRLLRVSSIFLSLHARAVVSANHPDRKRQRGEFELEEEERIDFP